MSGDLRTRHVLVRECIRRRFARRPVDPPVRARILIISKNQARARPGAVVALDRSRGSVLTERMAIVAESWRGCRARHESGCDAIGERLHRCDAVPRVLIGRGDGRRRGDARGEPTRRDDRRGPTGSIGRSFWIRTRQRELLSSRRLRPGAIPQAPDQSRASLGSADRRARGARAERKDGFGICAERRARSAVGR